MFEALVIEEEKIGLRINEDKTKFMIISRSQNLRDNFGPKLNIDRYAFEIVKEFTYLGTIITVNNDESVEIKKRLTKANKAYFGLAPLLRSKDLTRASKTTIYKTIIRPVLTYRSECWTLKDTDAAKVRVFETKILRRIFGANKISENI